MTWTVAITTALLLGLSGLQGVPAGRTVTLKGWFSDKDCAAPRIGNERVTPNGSACVRKCLDDGVPGVFVDPTARNMYVVRQYPGLKADVGYYLEVTGQLDEKAGTLAVESVKRLGDVVQMCALPPKKSGE